MCFVGRDILLAIKRTTNLNKPKFLTWCRLQHCFYQRRLLTSESDTNSVEANGRRPVDPDTHQPLASSPVTGHVTSAVPDFSAERGLGKTGDEQHWRMLMKPDTPPGAKILRVAILGTPNAGKSTLTNQLMCWRISAVSKKVHTTRRNTMAVFTEKNTQIIFVDTPGILHPSKRKRHNLDRSLVTDPAQSLNSADIVGVLVDVSNQWTRHSLDPNLLEVLHLHPEIPSILILNKVDAVNKKQLLLQVTQTLTEGVVNGVETKVVKKQPNRGFKKVDLEKYFRNLENAAQASRTNPVLGKESLKNEMRNDSAMSKSDVLKEREKFDDLNEFGSENPVFDDKNIDHGNSDSGFDQNKTSEKNENRHILPLGWRSKVTEGEGQETSQDQSFHEKLKEIRQKVKDKKGWAGFDKVFMVSALNGDGVEEIREYLMSQALPGEWEFHSSVVTDQDPRELAQMCVWERLLEHLPEEVPYTLYPEIVLWEVDEDGILKIMMDIITPNPRHPKIIMGKGGQIIQRIAFEAKQEIMNAFRCEVRLRLMIKLKRSQR